MIITFCCSYQLLFANISLWAESKMGIPAPCDEWGQVATPDK